MIKRLLDLLGQFCGGWSLGGSGIGQVWRKGRVEGKVVGKLLCVWGEGGEEHKDSVSW